MSSTAPIRLIVTDLDGTFLGRDGTPSPANRRAIVWAAERGVPTVFATGRPARWLQVLDTVRGAHPLVITSNGAMVIDLAQAKPWLVFPLDRASTAQLMDEVAQAHPGLTFAVEYVAGWAHQPGYPVSEGQPAPDLVSDAVWDLLAGGTALKLLIRGRPTAQLVEAVAPLVQGRLNLTYSVVSDLGLVELMAPEVSKGAALARLLDALAIDPADVAGFGDMPNDLDMLALVGHPYIMDNAHEVLKAHGFPTCGHHDDSAFATTVAALLG
jgi:Cof subfamily protein (haloacid dehalogenase superfamily)